MIRETIASALKSDAWTVKDAAHELDISADELADFCSVQENEFVTMLDDVCEFLGLELQRVFTNETWELYLERAWTNWGSKEPSLSYAAGKAEEWDAYSRTANGQLSYDDWSIKYDNEEFDAWEALALSEFERSERERLEKLSWVTWT